MGKCSWKSSDWSRIFLIMALVSVVGLFLHELGHGITVVLLGGTFDALYVFPGIEIYPHFGARYPGEFGLNVGFVTWYRGANWGVTEASLVRLMGSGATLLVSLLSFTLLWRCKPNGWLAGVLTGGSLMFIDMLLYTLLPELFGLKHFFIIGGAEPEPLDAAAALGMPRAWFVLLVIIVSSFLTMGLLLYTRRKQAAVDDGVEDQE